MQGDPVGMYLKPVLGPQALIEPPQVKPEPAVQV